MKCPLMVERLKQGAQYTEPVRQDCLKEECAWWDSVGQRCVTLSIYQELRLLVGAAGIIAEEAKKAGE